MYRFILILLCLGCPVRGPVGGVYRFFHKCFHEYFEYDNQENLKIDLNNDLLFWFIFPTRNLYYFDCQPSSSNHFFTHYVSNLNHSHSKCLSRIYCHRAHKDLERVYSSRLTPKRNIEGLKYEFSLYPYYISPNIKL